VRTLNPATYLPEEEGEPLHSCEKILDKVFSSRPDLTNTTIPNPNLELFTDESWSLQEGGYWTGYAALKGNPRRPLHWGPDQVVEHGQLPDHWSAQWAELYALTRADGKRVNIYTDSCYTFATLHIHGAIYKERGLLTSRGKIVNKSYNC
jgi:hypothetical protein